MDFPWNLILVVEVTTLPDPTPHTVLCAQRFINERLLRQRLLEVVVPDAFLDL